MSSAASLFVSGARVRHVGLHWTGEVSMTPFNGNQSVRVLVDGADQSEYFRKQDLIVIDDEEPKSPVKPPVKAPAAVASMSKSSAPVTRIVAPAPAHEPPRAPIQQLIDKEEERLIKAQREVRRLEDKIAMLKEVRKEINSIG